MIDRAPQVKITAPILFYQPQLMAFWSYSGDGFSMHVKTKDRRLSLLVQRHCMLSAIQYVLMAHARRISPHGFVFAISLLWELLCEKDILTWCHLYSSAAGEFLRAASPVLGAFCIAFCRISHRFLTTGQHHGKACLVLWHILKSGTMQCTS